MILSEIGNYVRLHQQATLNDIAQHFNAQPEAVRGMLDVWIRKGKISRQLITTDCGSSCRQCSTATTEIYTWGRDTTRTYSGYCPNK